jgi:hypothetical protein
MSTMHKTSHDAAKSSETAKDAGRESAKHGAKSHFRSHGRGNGVDTSLSAFDLANLPNPMLGLAQMQALAFRMFLTRQREVLDFLSRRCVQDLRLVDQIMSTRETGAMSTVMADFYRSAAADYSDELGRSVNSAPRAVAAAGEATLDLAKSISENAAHPQPA